MSEPILRPGIGRKTKKIYIEIPSHSLWVLQKIDLLAKNPFMRCQKVETDARRMSDLIQYSIDWTPIPVSLGIVIHKAVVARIIHTMTLKEAKDAMNGLACLEEAGPIYDGFLSNEHGRLYLTSKDLGWGWRLQRTKPERGPGKFFIERYNSKRVRPMTEEKVHLSVYGSLLTPVHAFMDSLLRDLGSFADPFSLLEFKKDGHVLYRYVDVPLKNLPRQLSLAEQFSSNGSKTTT